MINEHIVAEFSDYGVRLDTVRKLLQIQLATLLEQNRIKVQFVEARLKSRESLTEKLARPEKTYHSLWEITDLVGLRIITYFEDSITQAATLIEQHFQVDFSHSSNKLQYRDLGKFGYRSLHYTCALDAKAQTEIEIPPEFRFEIQIRTVLQHAWAEVEHDLGYKAQDTIPEVIRRRFNRVASLLEIADQEFETIKRDLKTYELTLREMTGRAAHDLPLDRISLAAIVLCSEVQSVDSEISTLLGRDLSTELFYPEYLLKMLRISGITTTKDLLLSLEKNRAAILEMITPYFDFARNTWNLSVSTLSFVHRGYSLFFLAHIAILESQSLELNKVSRLTYFYHELDYPNDERTASKVAGELYVTLSKGIRRIE